MDIGDALQVWVKDLNHTYDSFYDKDDNYIINFLDDNKEVVGNIKAVPGGIHWNYPQELMDAVH